MVYSIILPQNSFGKHIKKQFCCFIPFKIAQLTLFKLFENAFLNRFHLLCKLQRLNLSNSSNQKIIFAHISNEIKECLQLENYFSNFWNNFTNDWINIIHLFSLSFRKSHLIKGTLTKKVNINTKNIRNISWNHKSINNILLI